MGWVIIVRRPIAFLFFSMAQGGGEGSVNLDCGTNSKNSPMEEFSFWGFFHFLRAQFLEF